MDASTEPPSARLKHLIASACPRCGTSLDPRQSGVILGLSTTVWGSFYTFAWVVRQSLRHTDHAHWNDCLALEGRFEETFLLRIKLLDKQKMLWYILLLWAIWSGYFRTLCVTPVCKVS